MLPEWDFGGDDAKRKAFSRFINEALDAEEDRSFVEALTSIASADFETIDPSKLRQFVALLDEDFPPELVERIGMLLGMDIPRLLAQIAYVRSMGYAVGGDTIPAKRGVKSARRSAFHAAADDVPRIRALFLAHWGRHNRHSRPMAEEIAAARWDLSVPETDALIAKFQRRG